MVLYNNFVKQTVGTRKTKTPSTPIHFSLTAVECFVSHTQVFALRPDHIVNNYRARQ